MLSDLIEIKLISFKKRRGLVAKTNILKNAIVEEAPVLLLSDKDYDLIKKTVLDNYVFEWNAAEDSEYKSAIAFSICELLNHSYNPNLAYINDFEKNVIRFYAIRDISKGEELTINYNGNSNELDIIWFEID